MGFRLFSSCSDGSYMETETARITPTAVRERKVAIGNPDPANFKIIKCRKIRRFVIIWVNYPDSKNYEGNKILLFEGISLKRIREIKLLDPHFCDSKEHLSPVARFVPTIKGWDYAVTFSKNV